MQVLLIDDDKNLNKVLAHQLRGTNFGVYCALSGKEGLQMLQENDLDLVLLDIRLPDISGIDVLKQIRKSHPVLPVIMITAYGSVENVLEACRLGADDYITKPFGLEQLRFVIEKVTRLRKLERENLKLHNALEERYDFCNMVVKSPEMAVIMKQAVKVAASDTTVLILGESGTGKELLARTVHFNSKRKDKPFITVNCPSIPDHLMESELFGHVKGAFTGAFRNRKGKFQLADGGTIFLDEIAELKENLQAKLLRVLQDHHIERIGGSEKIKVNIRVIAATNKNLKKMIRESKFREDLYYRLNVVPLKLPPLRERKEEIPYLVDFFIKRYGKVRPYKISSEFFAALQNYDWPGNVRELENVVERAVVLSANNRLAFQDLPVPIRCYQKKLAVDMTALTEQGISLQELEQTAIMKALSCAGGNQSRAARILKIPRHVLVYRIKKFGLSNEGIL